MVRRTTPTLEEARALVAPLTAWLDDHTLPAPPRLELAAAVRSSARYLAGEHPGGAVELRIPPFVAVQCVEGLTHRRGTPPNVVELAPRTWLRLATGRLSWSAALANGEIVASGSRADLAALLPIAGLDDQQA